MFFCCKYASTSRLCPLGFRLNTSKSQLLDTEPDGPNSSIETTTRPVSHRTKRIKAPIMTIAGRSRRSAMSQKSPKMKTMVSAETVM